jgi:uncharacterized UBP type Zn finger protein
MPGIADSIRQLTSRLGGRGSGCRHLADGPDPQTRTTGCEECLAAGMRWVHLRLCLTCGHVGCCNASDGKHATAHFEETSHPVIRSHEPEETWCWCYVDQVQL